MSEGDLLTRNVRMRMRPIADSAQSGIDQRIHPDLRVRRRVREDDQPLVIDGVMYLATMYNRVVALDADTGKEIWVKDLGVTPSTRGL